MAAVGSSPHTRGLPHRRALGAVATGIIPAHAGFTCVGGGPHRAVADHPRTRGVYTAGPAPQVLATGSSPHTRGLPHRLGLTLTGQGIIPAHAGFTPRCSSAARRWRDHPRTRGVYPCAPSRAAGASRIIPAHAGFTVPRALCPVPPRDHPRTRGVYQPSARASMSRAGSSPHTRGLQLDGELTVAHARIIPAHAGFTRPSGPRGPGRADHPRTRGVYPRACRPAACTRDHPRTRGVYPQPARGRPGRPGSSPHTRGLRRGGAGPGPGRRIIPAHAGFTNEFRGLFGWKKDHPRTRGVYRRSSASRGRARGSSPHTRGLLTRAEQMQGVRGIIPAHAGFTGRGRTR